MEPRCEPSEAEGGHESRRESRLAAITALARFVHNLPDGAKAPQKAGFLPFQAESKNAPRGPNGVQTLLKLVPGGRIGNSPVRRRGRLGRARPEVDSKVWSYA